MNFFPDRGETTREAKKVCAACLVQVECRAFAIDNGERFGIWGGTSVRERRGARVANPWRRFDPATEDEVVATYASGISINELSIRFQCSQGKVRSVLERRSIPVRGRGGRPRSRSAA